MYLLYSIIIICHTGCTNQFVKVIHDSAAFIIRCKFLNQMDNSEKVCAVQYGPCSQNLSEAVSPNTTSYSVELDVRLESSESVGTLCVIASNSTHTVLVELKTGRKWTLR